MAALGSEKSTGNSILRGLNIPAPTYSRLHPRTIVAGNRDLWGRVSGKMPNQACRVSVVEIHPPCVPLGLKRQGFTADCTWPFCYNASGPRPDAAGCGRLGLIPVGAGQRIPANKFPLVVLKRRGLLWSGRFDAPLLPASAANLRVSDRRTRYRQDRSTSIISAHGHHRRVPQPRFSSSRGQLPTRPGVPRQ